MTNATMDPLHFAYWIKGYSEITNRRMPNEIEWRVINDHLDSVFTKATPERHYSSVQDASTITGVKIFSHSNVTVNPDLTGIFYVC